MEITGPRIPTLPPEVETGISAEVEHSLCIPGLADINDVIMRILDTTDLSIELEKIEVDIRQLAEPIAWAKSFEKRWEEAHASMVKARIHADDIVYRYLKRKESKQKRSRLTFMDVLVAKGVEKEKAAIIKRSRTKKRPYLERLVIVLGCILSEKSKTPYRYMAALFNLFNLRSEKGCDKCPRADKARCSEEIFSCIDHESTRQYLWKMAQAGKYSPDLQARLKDS